MMDEKLQNEMLSEEELEEVTGGTMMEFTQILSTVVSNTSLMKDLKDILVNVTGGNLNLEEVRNALTGVCDELGIKAKISVYTNKNVYTDKKTGKSISHDEVIKRIKNYS